VLERLCETLDVRLQVRRRRRGSLDLANLCREHVVKRRLVLLVVVTHHPVARQILPVHVHRKIPGLLGRPLARRVGGAGRDPDPSRADVDEHQKVKIDHATDRPFPLAGEVALPHRGGVAFQEFGPSIRMVLGLGAETGFDQHVLHGLARNRVPQPPHRLNDLRVPPAPMHPIRNRMTN
jgi:hypothetical protein